MRLTGGLDRGRKLKAPRGLKTRPTASKVREAVFNILGPPPNGDVLDLFAGTGSLGIEALSRGAASAVFVERDSRALAALRKNLAELGLQQRAAVVGRDVLQALASLASEGRRFAWVFVDPPYAAGEVEHVLRALGCHGLAAGGVVIVEHDKRSVPPDESGGLILTDRRYYGDTGLSFYRCQQGLAA
ncbi:MAG: 16S rRNA (guanine(966)-N(2))-methyltransferase RsmD [Myxococcales bacterium]|nr:16S rRNA (guanine(966)-N(2))-methyltransferase RsmD [Myxococcales bacterium]